MERNPGLGILRRRNWCSEYSEPLGRLAETRGSWEGREQACCKPFQLLSTEVKHLSDSAWGHGALGRVSSSLAQCLPLLPVLLGATPLSCHRSVGASPSSPNHPSPSTLIPNATTCTCGYSHLHGHLAFHIMESCSCVWLLSLSIMFLRSIHIVTPVSTSFHFC